MAVSTRIDSIDRDIALLIQDSFSPAARSSLLAQFAREQLAEAQTTNKSVLGRVPEHSTYVDGAENDNLDAVKPDGSIVFEFELLAEAITWVREQLKTHSPVRSGRYRDSNILLADGVEIDADGDIPEAAVYVLTNSEPYAGKIERGLSKQSPDGVYEVVAELASKRFGNIARFRFGYSSSVAGSKDKTDRRPSITVTV